MAEKLPTAVLETRDRYVKAFPLWSMEAGPAAEERARTWSMGLCSQICFEHGPTYGSKRADPNRPISKDAVARQDGPTLLVWDMLTGAGSGSPTLVKNPDSQDVTGQVFQVIKPADVIAGEGMIIPDDGGSEPEPAPVIPYNEAYSRQFGEGCNDVYTESKANVDPGMISVHSQRAAWDYYTGQMTWDESYTKHINEFRAEYKLPPV